MSFDIGLSRQAEAYLERLDRRTRDRFGQAIRALADDPYGPATKPLHGVGGRALRVGGWRVLYSVDTGEQRVTIDLIVVRGQAYRNR